MAGSAATPALHTSEIFGKPIYSYSYRSAVVDGYLIDHEPPIQITTKLSKDGIYWAAGSEVKVYDPQQTALELWKLDDAVTIDIEGFNRKVITPDFNRVVCEYLAREIDPESRQKTLVFCVNDQHADLVTDTLKAGFQKQYGRVEDDAVMKITGSVDRPLELIRRYKNERNPNVAITVDLLTTGVDVPAICNLVFLRRVNSRILYDQMLGRATRRCDEVDKDYFKIYDAVKIYEAMKDVTEMQPVVVDPKITFARLAVELATVTEADQREFVRDQFVARLRRKKHHMTESSRRDFETEAGMSPDLFMEKLMGMSMADVASWFTQHAGLGEILDRKGVSTAEPMFVSEHPDEVIGVERGYGTSTKPEDYLEAFQAFVRSNSNTIPALITVLTRPRDLTRKELRDLMLELGREGFNESNLRTAWRQMTNEDIAAEIVGHIRRAAMGDPLVPYEQRVENALQSILRSKSWSTQQQKWLKLIAAQTKANIVVDRESMDDRDQIFKRDGGGFERINRVFDGDLENVLQLFNERVWNPAA